jgi:hypothetical protein
MACSKYSLTNTGTTLTNFNYRRCDDTMWQYQVSLEPNQTKNIWLIDDTYSTSFITGIVLTNEGVFPPVNVTPTTPTNTPTVTQTPSATIGLTPTSTQTTTPTPTTTQTNTPTNTETPTPTPTTPENGWYFYSPEGTISGPPTSDGNIIFNYSNYPGTSTYNPNYTGNTFNLFINNNTNIGTSYFTEFDNLNNSGGTITISQGSNIVIYSGTSSQFALPTNFLQLSVVDSSQFIQSAATSFISGSVISIVVS